MSRFQKKEASLSAAEVHQKNQKIDKLYDFVQSDISKESRNNFKKQAFIDSLPPLPTKVTISEKTPSHKPKKKRKSKKTTQTYDWRLYF